MAIFNLVLGLILLVFGRKLFWLFVAIAGFLFGIHFGSYLLPDQPQWIMILVALCAGLLGALLAVVAQHVAFALAGFYGGSYLALVMAQSFGVGRVSTLLVVVAGVVGAIIAALIMNWAIILISSLVGAGAVVDALALEQPMNIIVFLVLATVGIVVQAKLLPQPKEK
jgi:MFS family permease